MKNNNFYALEDFVATVLRLPIKKEQIRKVLYAWGHTNGSSKEKTGTELRFGAIILLKNTSVYLDRVAYITGGNDYTGWGCQDGAMMYYSTNWFYSEDDDYLSMKPERFIKEFEEISEFDDFDEIVWDKEPVDLNRWLKGEIEVDEEYLK